MSSISLPLKVLLEPVDAIPQNMRGSQTSYSVQKTPTRVFGFVNVKENVGVTKMSGCPPRSYASNVKDHAHHCFLSLAESARPLP